MENTKVIHKVFYAVLAIAISIVVPIKTASADENTQLNVNVRETLSVSITTPTTWASGDIDTFLRNKVTVSVTANNAAGFTASMTTRTANTSLTNTAKNTYTIPTLSSSVTRSAFPANYWGYSFDDTENGSGTSTYSALVGAGSTPIIVLSSNSATTGSKDFYFGAKANATKASGTYVNTVVISVVSGVIDDSTNPTTPTNPVTPGANETPTYDSNKNVTHYTYSSTSSGTTSKNTQISSGDNRSAYDNYVPPQGVIYDTKSQIGSGLTLASGLGVAAAIATTSGFFFLAAARREGEDDDEDNQQ